MIRKKALRKGAKGEISRENIMKAARMVFAEYPYKSASLRLIGKQGGFEHPLIHYYFPSKAELFRAVIQEMCDEFYQATLTWFEGLAGKPPEVGLASFIERLLDYSAANPEPFRMIFMNMATISRLEEIPGAELIPELFARLRNAFMDRLPVRGGEEEIIMYTDSFNTLAISYLGASGCHAQVLGLEPDSPEYRNHLKNTLMFLFLPQLIRFILPTPQQDKQQ